MAGGYLLSMKSITKEFPGVRALANVDLDVRKGTVHALVGENGAGKSTLMKCLIGLYKPDSGTITFKGEPLNVTSTNLALARGISMIHQELNPVPHMTVAENVLLGREPTTWCGFVDTHRMNCQAKAVLDKLAIRLDPAREMAQLSIAGKQLVEIAKAISCDSELVIMDEPTSALTDTEAKALFRVIDSLRALNRSVVYISHKIDEVFRISDEVTVLRDGRHVSTDPTDTLTERMLIQKMVGRAPTEMFRKETTSTGKTVLEIRNLSGSRFKGVSFRVMRGEILGVAGLMGSGRTDLLEAVFGLTRCSAGEILANGNRVKTGLPADAIRHGMALLTEDRKLTGLFPNATVRDNMAIANLRNYLGGLFLDFVKMDSDCERMRERIKIKTWGLRQTVKHLSGGNQQKVLLARWLLTGPDILILDEPTRGIDIGAKFEIYRLMREFVREGKSIIMISSELPEILGMSDRVIVMHEGEKVGELTREEATEEKILHLATGLPLPASLHPQRGNGGQ